MSGSDGADIKKKITQEYIEKSEKVDYSVTLPDSELDVMFAFWGSEPPYTTSRLMQCIGAVKGWKSPTLISFLNRLEERGYIMSYKNGKERNYIPLAEKKKYIRKKTAAFAEKYHSGSFVSILDSLYGESGFPDDEIDNLIEWLRKH